MSLSTKAILETVDMRVVAESLGLEMKTYGKRYSILCPFHNDKHFGSCVLTENGYHCFACGAHGNVFRLIQHVLHISYSNAIRYTAEICGGEAQFDYKVGTRAFAESRGYLSIAQQHLLGIHNNPVEVCSEFIIDSDEVDAELVHVTPSITHDGWTDGYIVHETKSLNPLYELFYHDKESYHMLVENFCAKKMSQYQTLWSIIQHPDNQPENIQHLVFAITKSFTTHQLAQFFHNRLWEIQKISVASGTGSCANQNMQLNADSQSHFNIRSVDIDLIADLQMKLWQQAAVPF